MINTFKARTYRSYDNAVLNEVVLGFSPTTQVRIARIDGLGPVKNVINNIENSSDPGSYFLSAKPENRNIVLAVELNHSPLVGLAPGDDPSTAALLRDYLTDVFMPGQKIEIEINADQVGTVNIWGVVESNDPEIFTQKPTVTISIICHDPYFFKVPYALTTLPMTYGIGVDANVFYVDNPSKLPSSFTFGGTVSIARPNGISVSHEDASGPVSLYNTVALAVGDTFLFDTRKGQRKVQHVRSGATVDDVGYFSGSLTDSKLMPGRNWFRFNDKGAVSGVLLRTETPIEGL